MRMRTKHKFIRQVVTSLTLSALLSLTASGLAWAEVADRDGKLLTVGPPMFPAYCLNRRLQGYVDFVFVVGTAGHAHDASVVDAGVYKRSPSKPIYNEIAKQKFFSAANASLANFRYDPQIKDGQLLSVEGVRTRINFLLER